MPDIARSFWFPLFELLVPGQPGPNKWWICILSKSAKYTFFLYTYTCIKVLVEACFPKGPYSQLCSKYTEFLKFGDSIDSEGHRARWFLRVWPGWALGQTRSTCQTRWSTKLSCPSQISGASQTLKTSSITRWESVKLGRVKVRKIYK